MVFNKADLSVVLYIQTESKIESMTKKELLPLIDHNVFPKDDFDEYIAFDNDPQELKPFTCDALKGYLQLKYRRSFPFSMSIFTGHVELLRKTILWWFTKYTDFDPNNINLPDESKLNEDQFKLIYNVNNNLIKRKTLLQVINAGPGTGKTTSANALAYNRREEGVLLISYTNESIKENYKRFFDYPCGKNTTGLKKYNGPLINLITVDSLAAKIIGDASDKNFDEIVQRASIRIDPLLFIHPIRGRMYNHIVVDECQDIDDLRGNFIMSFCEKIGVKSLTLCGDPRQKIRDHCGKWYTELWENTFDYRRNGHMESNFGPVFRVGFSQSYRFQNDKIVDLVNHLSQQRPNLHVTLKGLPSMSAIPVQVVSIDRLMCEGALKKLLIPGETNCIIGPSVEADNRTANVGRTIAGIFRSNGYPLSFKTEGAFQPDSTPFLTIHSVKGREFDNVFIFGMSNYPASFSMIPHDEAMSLIFVAHSRAKKHIYYIDGSDAVKFTLPLHVENTFVNTESYEGTLAKSHQEFENLNSQDMRHFSVTNMVEDHSFTRFLEENRFFVNPDENWYQSEDWNSRRRPKCISPEAWGFITGFDVASQLTSYKNVYDFYFGDIISGNYVVLPEDAIVKQLLSGVIINNRRVKDNVRVFQREITEIDLKVIMKHRLIPSLGAVLYIFAKYYKDETLDLETLQRVLDFSETSRTNLCGSPSLVEALKGGEVEVSLSDNDHKVLHGRADYIDSEKNVYEFKSTSLGAKEYKSMLQAWLYHVMIDEEESFAYILDLEKGQLHELSSDESVYRWRYIIKSYFILRHHVDLVTARRNYYLLYGTPDQKKPVIIPDNVFTVDTEFFGKDIFEIALVNINDPYRTITDLLTPTSLDGMMFALDWLPGTQTEMYKSNVRQLRVKFNMSTCKSKEDPSMSYYIASTDVDWCERKNVSKINLSSSARKATEQLGCSLAGNFGPKLGELYTILAPFPLEYQPHLQAHTALADALMLYELLRLGLLKM